MCKAFLQPLKDWLTTQHHKAMRRLLYRRQHRTTSDRRISNIDKFTSSESFYPGRQRKNNIIFIMTIICEIHNQNCLIVCRYLDMGFSVSITDITIRSSSEKQTTPPYVITYGQHCVFKPQASKSYFAGHGN